MSEVGEGWFKRRVYEAKYTAGAYTDCILSFPIWTAEKTCGLAGSVFDGKPPQFFDVDKMREDSFIYQVREGLREKMDTRPGTLYIQSNLLSLVPFVAVGMPAAEAAQLGIERYLESAPELVKCTVNSLATLGAQMSTAYLTFMANEVRTNKHKFENENGKLSGRKISSGLWNAVKTFWKFDLTFIAAKLGLQTRYLMTDRDPWLASAKADGWGAPLWFSVAIPLGLKGGIIETNDSERVYGSRKDEAKKE